MALQTRKIIKIGETALLQEIRKRFPPKGGNVLRSIGDDCALLSHISDNLIVTTDTLNEGIHFDQSYTSAYALGFKLLSVNVSDIYAMGGSPFAVFLNISMSPETKEDFFWDLYEGLQEGLSIYNMDLLGGDLCASRGDISVSATVLGTVKRAVCRSGAKEGDLICVTGNLGDSALGLRLLMSLDIESRQDVINSRGLINLQGRIMRIVNDTAANNTVLGAIELEADEILPLIKRHLMPTARQSMGFADIATAMIDISDGLFIDLCRLCDESSVGARVYQNKLPASKDLLKTAERIGAETTPIMTCGGEDYELLFTVGRDALLPVDCGFNITVIGEVTSRERTFIDHSGIAHELTPKGYEHFKG